MPYDLLICSLPRSGSHALMSGLHSHPDISMTGEIGMIDKFPLPPSEGTLKGAIWPAYRLSPHPLPLDTPVIFIVRPLNEIKVSLGRNGPRGTDYSQHLQPTVYHGHSSRLSHERTVDLTNQWFDLRSAMQKHGPKLVLKYQELYGTEDCREILCGDEICDWLGVERHPLVPLTYKPQQG